MRVPTAGWMACSVRQLVTSMALLRRKLNSVRIVGAMRRLVPAVAVVIAVLAAVLAPTAAFAQGSETCPGGGYNLTPVAVAVTAVPIVVASTTDDYFVLYVRHDLDGTEVEIPVLVKRGEAGTTTLAENVAALPAERYQVEKYQVGDPADVRRRLHRRRHRTRRPGGHEPGEPRRGHRHQPRRLENSQSRDVQEAPLWPLVIPEALRSSSSS